MPRSFKLVSPCPTVPISAVRICVSILEIVGSFRSVPLFAFSSHCSISFSFISFFCSADSGWKSRYFGSRICLFNSSISLLYSSTNLTTESKILSVSGAELNVTGVHPLSVTCFKLISKPLIWNVLDERSVLRPLKVNLAF